MSKKTDTGVPMKNIQKIFDEVRPPCRDNLFREGKQGVKKAAQFFGLSFMYLLTGVLYMFRGAPTAIKGLFLNKKKAPGIVVCELPWVDQSGLDVGYHFPLLNKNKERIVKMALAPSARIQERKIKADQETAEASLLYLSEDYDGSDYHDTRMLWLESKLRVAEQNLSEYKEKYKNLPKDELLAFENSQPGIERKTLGQVFVNTDDNSKEKS